MACSPLLFINYNIRSLSLSQDMIMLSPTHRWSIQTLLMMFHLFILSLKPIITCATFTSKLDQTLVPQEPDTGIKCGTSPCADPYPHLPCPPPPPPKNAYCAPCTLPPPPPRFIYVTGVPGNLYPSTDTNEWTFYSSARRNVETWLMFFVGYGVLGLFAI
ncbi:hypothetical protein CFOL_v3_16613 [Cephalotus follicularis]|uniref:Uncharacterized protein n=1 Tax=Cephalotus follicularis TaxID=3775 RepID=A0A1Q3BYN6_CEPFO|nr:hypothetical protein CFOL_v3_16613 [Cephalotus follicularis]